MSADLLKKLIEAGTPAHLVAEVALVMGEIGALERAREKNRERQQRKRDREKEVTLCNVTSRDERDTVSPLDPPLKTPPDPLKITPPISPHPPLKIARASRLTIDWQPEPLKGKAAEMVSTWQPGAMERELAKFKNYWISKGGKDAAKLNWQRTWINWLISADERKPRQSNERSSNPLRDAVSNIIANG